jgi:hypothetical protein
VEFPIILDVLPQLHGSTIGDGHYKAEEEVDVQLSPYMCTNHVF